MIPVILAGGVGSRLWPLSSPQFPKQFHQLTADNTQLQATFSRISHLDFERAIVVCNNDQRFLAAEQLKPNLDRVDILLESEGKNTAPATAIAAFQALEQELDPVLVVLPADHFISDARAFSDALAIAKSLANEGHLVTFGVPPTRSETDYGYIEKERCLSTSTFSVKKFVEKPDKTTAKSYFKSGNYLWNSGMFVFKANQYLRALKRFAPEIFHACKQSVFNSCRDLDFIRIDEEEFKNCPSNSIDYAVMEPVSNDDSDNVDIVAVTLDVGWSDIGSWAALSELSQKDSQGNSRQGNSLINESSNCFVKSEEKFVVLNGVHDLVVVESKNGILVSHKEAVSSVGELSESTKVIDETNQLAYQNVYRPWGRYEIIAVGKSYKIKKIYVNPGAKLSLQKHAHRAEHWVVVSGTAKVILQSKSFLISENESTFISVGEVHSLENPTEVMLELIEVQTGDYLVEDDIVRLEDNYGRKVSSDRE